MSNLQVHDYIENIDCTAYRLMGEIATAPISAFLVRQAMLKKYQGLAIALFFSYTKRTGKTILYTVQLRIPG